MIGNETADAVAKPYYNRITPPKLRDNPEISLQKEKKQNYQQKDINPQKKKTASYCKAKILI